MNRSVRHTRPRHTPSGRPELRSAGEIAWRRARDQVRRDQPHTLDGLRRLVSIPTVSADPSRRPDLERAAKWLAQSLTMMGLERAQIWPTGGPPAVYADWVRPGRRPTVLIYAHYDVQPAATEDGWDSPPFRPTSTDQHLYGRGVSDDKGPLFAHLAGIAGWLRSCGRLPVNVRLIVDGEEEIGSPHFPLLLDRHRDELRADLIMASDTRMLGPGQPALVRSLRGAVNLELIVRGGPADLHSGSFGGIAPQATVALAHLLASLVGPDGTLLPAGLEPDGEDLPRGSPTDDSGGPALPEVGPSDGRLRALAGVNALWGTTGRSAYERTTIHPAITITSLQAGYSGKGPKSIVPAAARAKLNCRLAPGQEPAAFERALRAHLLNAARRFEGTRVGIRQLSSTPGVETNSRHSSILTAAARAYTAGFGRPAVLTRSGGSIPPVGMLAETLRLPVVLAGFGLPDDAIHGPNERLHLPTFERSCVVAARLLYELAAIQPRRSGLDH